MRIIKRSFLGRTLLLAGFFLCQAMTHAEPIPVELRNTDSGWQLYRGGEPYFIRGAGGAGPLDALAAAGANSIRTWGGDVGTLLDDAHALGMTVTVGIWLGHERHGFDYDDPAQLAKQLDDAREMVLKYRDHPALLLWGVGNEMEGFDDGGNPAIWKAVNDVAAMVKELDPNHPTMTVTTFVHGERIEFLHRRSPAIDIHGVNAYGGAQVVPQLLREGGATKPYVLTEFGAVGPWEMPTTAWGAPYEQTSSEKAAFYRETYEKAILDAPGVALGSYAFLWGHKMEATETWFGMFLPDGSRTAAIDTMTEIWGGKAPGNRAPAVDRPEIDGPATVEPGEIIEVRTSASDPDDDALDVTWVLRPEAGDYNTGGDFRAGLPAIDDAIIETGDAGARVRMPEQPGPYRLFVYAHDGHGNAATANLPLLVEGEARIPLPFPVYEDGFGNMPWAPSGWMGGVEHLTLDGEDTGNPHSGKAAIRLRYDGTFGWVAVAWQHPPNNWGDQDGGFDLTGARALEVWARGEYGGEEVSFGVGLLGDDKAFPDSSISKVDGIRLGREWKKYEVPLKRKDLSSIKTGFVVSVTGRRSPVTIYLDGIRYVR